VPRKKLKQIQDWLNERPRKVLERDTPLNVLNRFYMKQNLI